MTLKEWLEKIHQLHPRKWDLGLERVGSVGLRLNVLKPAERLFLVAGTNGKGSTCEFLSRLCHELGISYGTTTSPFLLDYNEQININGQPVDDAEIVSAFETIDEARRDISLTYFEFGALAALLIFSRYELDVAIVEVGLGGRLDAMNIVEPDLSIVTRVDIDHQEWLGIDREGIGREKAGILRAGRPGVFVDSDPPQSLFEEAEKLGVKTYCMGEDISFENDILTFKDQRYNLANCSLPAPSLVAAICALQIEGFQISQEHVDRTKSKANLAGRFQVIDTEPKVILDVAHNQDAARFLLNKLKSKGYTSVRAVIGMYTDKDVEQVFQILSPLIREWYLCDLDVERGSSAQELLRRLSDSCGCEGKTYDKVAVAYEAATTDSQEGEVVLVFGSFAVVAAALRCLQIPVRQSWQR